MVQSLFQISQALCVKQASRITDVGDTPYHLIKPILRRLNSKQLAILEENSPCIMPETDELWALLVEKEFADRPYNANKARLLSTENDMMPNRALFKQYTAEKEKFLASSAQRLRKLTANLQKEKSKNSIVPITGILRDPSIRRRTAHPRSVSSSARPSSILGKARKDMSERSLMFRVPPSASDSNGLYPRPARSPALPSAHKTPSRDLTAINTSASNGIYSHGHRIPKPDQRPSNSHSSSSSPQSHSNSRPAAPPQNQHVVNNEITSTRTKRLPSMFSNSRKKQRLAPTSGSPREPAYKPRSSPRQTLSKSPVKSSIFY